MIKGVIMKRCLYLLPFCLVGCQQFDPPKTSTVERVFFNDKTSFTLLIREDDRVKFLNCTADDSTVMKIDVKGDREQSATYRKPTGHSNASAKLIELHVRSASDFEAGESTRNGKHDNAKKSQEILD
jgi:hypothetical protein